MFECYCVTLAIREYREWECTELSSIIDGALILRGITRGESSHFHVLSLFESKLLVADRLAGV